MAERKKNAEGARQGKEAWGGRGRGTVPDIRRTCERPLDYSAITVSDSHDRLSSDTRKQPTAASERGGHATRRRASVPNGSDPGPAEGAARICRSVVCLPARNSSSRMVTYTGNILPVSDGLFIFSK